MSTSEKYENNKLQGQDIKVICPNCSIQTHHKVSVSFDYSYAQYDDEYGTSVFGNTSYQIIQCQGCKQISFRSEATFSEDVIYYGNGEAELAVTEELYPPRVEGKKGLGFDSHYLPSDIRRIYNETYSSLNTETNVLAGIGLRALVETVCKEKNALGGNLYDKINNLVQQGVLTKANSDVLHKIRTLGNEAAHEVKPHKSSQLWLAMEIIENLLKNVYIIPQRADEEFN